MGFDAKVCGHPRDDHLIDPSLAKLKHEIVRFRSVHLVRIRHHGNPIIDVRQEDCNRRTTWTLLDINY